MSFAVPLTSVQESTMAAFGTLFMNDLVSIEADTVRVEGDNPTAQEDIMKQYLLSLYQPDGPVPEPEVLGKIMQELEALNTQMRAVGAWVFAGALHGPGASTVVRAQDGDVLVTDGPFAGKRPGRTGTRRPLSCTPGTNQSRRTRCGTTGCGQCWPWST